MQVKTDGLILYEKNISDNDRLLYILTRNFGVIRAFSKGSRISKNKNFAATQTFCFSDFIIFKGKNKYIINEANLKNSFWDLRNDMESLTLAQYFCEVVLSLVDENFESNNILRLILNSIYSLGKNNVNNKIIKSVFEMRILSMLGYMPNLIGCHVCNNSDSDNMFFLLENNSLICSDCCENKNNLIKLSLSLLTALRYCIYADFSKMFSFEINKNNLKLLNKITESCLLAYIDKPLNTLDFYKKIIEN